MTSINSELEILNQLLNKIGFNFFGVETMSSATSYGTANIVSTKERGAAFTINIPVKVTATLKENKKIQGKISPELKKVVKKTLKFFSHLEYGVKIKVDNKIPDGLGREEALSLALIFSVAGNFA